MFVLSFKNGDNDPARDSFKKYYMPLVEINDFNALIDNKLFFDQPVKTNKKRVKNLLKCQEIMTMQQEIIIDHWYRFIKINKYEYSPTN